MEFDGTLSVLQGFICSLGSRDLLNKEDSLQEVVEVLKNVIEDKPNDAKSKIAFFLVLNTHLSVSKELQNNEFVGLITNITPPIDKAYLITYIYHLNLQSELFKVIENCPGTLGGELTGEIIKKLEDPKFHRDKFGVEHLYQLWESIFVKVCKISIGLHVNDNLQEFQEYFFSMCTLILKILVVLMHLMDMERTAGLHIYYFLKSLLLFIKLSKNPNFSDDPLYKLSTEIRDEKCGTVGDSVKVCIDLVWEKVAIILENLTLDLWMTFTEYYFDFDKENSMQAIIGDVVHRILEEIKGSNFSSCISNCLSSLAINKLDNAGLDEIISNVQSGKKEWFETLLKHPDVTKENSLKCLMMNINLATTGDLDKILNMSYSHIFSAEQDETLDLMKDLFLTAIKRTEDHSKWLEKVFENYKPDLLITTHTKDDLIETFNKMSKDGNILKNELISLCIQSPLETIKKICHLAVVGSLLIDDVIEVLKLLQHPCRTFHWDGLPCIDYVLIKSFFLENLTDKEKQSLINLIMHMGKEDLLGPHFSKNLLKALKVHLENVALEKAGLCLEILKNMLNLKLLVIDEVVLLVFLSQVLGHLTWDLKSYLSVKADGRDLVVGIVDGIINGIEITENDPKYYWARKEIVKSCEINQVCFCELWFSFGCNWPGSEKLRSCILTLAHSRRRVHDLRWALINKGQSSEERASIVLSLTMLLPVLCFREWNSIFEGLIDVLEDVDSGKGDIHHNVLDMFGSSLYLLTLTLKGEEAAYPCYEYSLRNFGRLVRQLCPKIPVESIVHIFEKILFVITAIENEEERKSCWMMLSTLLLELTDWIKKKNALDAHKNEIEKLLSLLDVKEVVEAIAKRLI